MKAFLMFQDRDLDRGEKSSALSRDLERDLDLGRLCAAMADSDPYVRSAAEQTLRAPLTAAEDITYRQRILIDALEKPEVIKDLYTVAVDTVAAEKRSTAATSSAIPMRCCDAPSSPWSS